MAINFTYPTAIPKITDLVIGTQTPDPLSSETDTPTRNFTIKSIVDLAAAGGGTGISLLTAGTSGLATLAAGVLNIPDYSSDPAIVKTTGIQTIAGAKTFTTNIVAPNVTNDNTGDQSLSIAGQVLTISGTNSSVTLPSGGGGTVTSLTTTNTSGASTLVSGVLNVPNYANTEYTLTSTGASGAAATLVGTVINVPTPVIPAVNFTTLATVGTSGAATLVSGVLNIPNYASASGAFLPLAGGEMTGAITSAASANLIVKPGTSIIEVQGDGTSVEGAIKLNCAVNSHGQTIKAQPHSEQITNTMLMPKGSNSTLVSAATETGVITVSSATGTSTGSPLTAAIVGRALSITSNVYNGTSNLGVVPAGGSATTFLRGDGFWATPAGGGGGSGTVTSVAALTLGTAGTDLASTVANGATTPVITLNVPTASATNRGALSSTDWSTFNNKTSTTVVDNLTTTSTTDALSANQGVVLKGLIDTNITAIGLNTAKIGISTTQAANIVTNNGKTGISTTQAANIVTNNGKTGITSAQAANIVTNNGKVTDTGLPAILNSAGSASLTAGITALEVRNEIGAGTSSLAIGTTNTTALAGNTTTISTVQATAINKSVKNDTDIYNTPDVEKIISLTQAQYTAITTPNVNTLYIII